MWKSQHQTFGIDRQRLTDDTKLIFLALSVQNSQHKWKFRIVLKYTVSQKRANFSTKFARFLRQCIIEWRHLANADKAQLKSSLVITARRVCIARTMP